MRVGQRSFFGLAKRSFPFWFGGIWLVWGVPFLIVGIYVAIDTMHQHARFKNDARVTEGMVLTKRISRTARSGKKDSTSYWVSYRFSASDGSVVKSETKVSAAVWDRLVEREPVRVTYVPDQPRDHWIDDQGPDWMLPLIFTAVGVVLVPLGGWIFSTGVRGILSELRLRDEGTLAEATVVNVEPTSLSFNGIAQWRVHYRYQDHRGRTHSGESGLMAPETAQEWKPGDHGPVRFDARAPQKSVWIGKA